MVQLCRPYGEGITCLCDQAKAVLKWGNTISASSSSCSLSYSWGEKKLKGCIEYRRYSFVFSLSHLLLTRILTAGVFSPATNKLPALQKTHKWYFVAYFLLVAGFYWPIKGRPQLKKNVFFQGLQGGGGGGSTHARIFWPSFRSAFLVNKKSLFLQKCQCIELLTVF